MQPDDTNRPWPERAHDALVLASVLCDAVPHRAQTSEDPTMRHIGHCVNNGQYQRIHDVLRDYQEPKPDHEPDAIRDPGRFTASMLVAIPMLLLTSIICANAGAGPVGTIVPALAAGFLAGVLYDRTRRDLRRAGGE